MTTQTAIQQFLQGTDSKVISYKAFELLLRDMNIGWIGVKYWNRADLDLFEEKADGFTVEPFENGMKIWDRNFDYSNL